MKRIGILSGMGAAAGARALSLLVKQCQDNGAKRDSDFPEIVLFNVSSTGMNEGGIADENEVIKSLCAGLEMLNRCWPDKIIVACNTAHLFLDVMREASLAEVIDLPGLAKDSCAPLRPGVMCSRSSSDAKLFGKNAIYPTDEEQASLDEVIARVIDGNANGETTAVIYDIAAKMTDRGAEKIIIGCTELSVICDTELFIDPIRVAIGKVLE